MLEAYFKYKHTAKFFLKWTNSRLIQMLDDNGRGRLRWLAGRYHGFPLVSPLIRPSLNSALCQKALCLLDSLPLLFQPGIWIWIVLDGRNAEEARLIVIESGWAAATWGMRESRRWKQKSLLWCQSRMHAYALEGRMKKAGLLSGETMFLFKNINKTKTILS